MAVIYYLGNLPVGSRELEERLDTITRFSHDRLHDEHASLNLNSGTILAPEFNQYILNNQPTYHPIGVGKPLSIEILSIYTGEAPSTLFGKAKDIMVVSGVKSAHTFDAAPRAINLIKRKPKDHLNITNSAFDKGSPIVYYTRAVDSDTLLCSFELVAETFNKKTFDSIAALMAAAGGMPIFAPAMPWLMAGSTITVMAGKLTQPLFESQPFLRDDLILHFNTPGMAITMAGHIVICNNLHEEELMEYTPALNPKNELVMRHRKTGDTYRGEAPYLIVNLDGRKRKALDDFTPQQASAALLKKFYATRQKSEMLHVFRESLTLYRDRRYQETAATLEKQLLLLAPGTPEHEQTSALLHACYTNIRNAQFLPDKKHGVVLED